MDYIECEKIQNAGYCADNDCNCSLTPLPRGGGYIYISEEVVEFRKDALSLAEVQEKLEHTAGSGEYISTNKYAPILVCEIAAYRRNLDLVVAKDDAKMYWREGRVPLRATPLAKIEEPLFPDSDLQSQQGDPAQDAINDKNCTAEDSKIPETVLEKNRPGSDVPDVNNMAPALRDVSVDEVLDQFSSGPLAELAKKMAQGMGSANSHENSSAGIIPETVITSGASLRPMDQEFEGDFPSSHLPKKKNSLKKIKPEKSKPLVPGRTVISVLTVVGIVLGISGLAAATALIIVKLRKSRPVAVETQPPEQDVAEPPAEITRSFFEKTYLFVDEHCKGTMSFTLSDDFRGEYIQSVNLKGKDKMYRVHGVFTYTVNSITYRPDSYSKDIVWILDEYDQDGNAAFHDPSEEDSKAARVYLRAEKF
ncbi:MAG: hypothetical protein JW915_11700 [Chitinispirillaceae bacterium]|nr:hypothetical protein [Chitinispirillaceae bacterium]